MAAPSMTFNAKGNVTSSTSLPASGTLTFNLDFSAKWEGQVQVEVVFGTVAATSGVQVDTYRQFGAGPTNDTIPVTEFVIPSTASATKDESFAESTGKYQLKLTNLDATNAVTVSVTTSTVDSIG